MFITQILYIKCLLHIYYKSNVYYTDIINQMFITQILYTCIKKTCIHQIYMKTLYIERSIRWSNISNSYQDNIHYRPNTKSAKTKYFANTFLP